MPGCSREIDGRRDRLAWRVLTSIEDLDAHLVGLRRGNLDLLDLEGLAGTPANSRLAGDRLSNGIGHCGRW